MDFSKTLGSVPDLKAAAPPLLPVDSSVGPLRVDVVPAAVGQANGGLSQAEIDAIPVFEYCRKAPAAPAPSEQCAVCINVPPAHTFHAPCIDGWLRAHATCPMCRADVKVAVDEGLPAAESSAAAA